LQDAAIFTGGVTGAGTGLSDEEEDPGWWGSSSFDEA
jgi:hypothetical protein